MDKTRTVYIGGQMGNQLLGCFMALADSLENNYKIESFTVTHAPDYLEKMLELKVPTQLRAEEKINDINHNSEQNVYKLFRNRSRIIEEGWVKLKEPGQFEHSKTCVHMRGTDKKVAPLQWYYNKIRRRGKDGSVHVCTDDKWRRLLLKTWILGTGISNVNFIIQNAIRDWFTLLNADTVYCSSSSFPLSTLLFNPDKEIIICSRKSTSYDFQIESRKIAEFGFIESAMKYCPNLRFED